MLSLETLMEIYFFVGMIMSFFILKRGSEKSLFGSAFLTVLSLPVESTRLKNEFAPIEYKQLFS